MVGSEFNHTPTQQFSEYKGDRMPTNNYVPQPHSASEHLARAEDMLDMCLSKDLTCERLNALSFNAQVELNAAAYLSLREDLGDVDTEAKAHEIEKLTMQVRIMSDRLVAFGKALTQILDEVDDPYTRAQALRSIAKSMKEWKLDKDVLG